jgi:hypothetical protein
MASIAEESQPVIAVVEFNALRINIRPRAERTAKVQRSDCSTPDQVSLFRIKHGLVAGRKCSLA